MADNVSVFGVVVDPKGAVVGSAKAGTAITGIGRKAQLSQKKTTKAFALMSKAAARLGGVIALAFTFKKAITQLTTFETALVGVKKTTGLVGEELELFASDINKMESQTKDSAQSLLSLAAAAGQLGVKGREDLLLFTKVMSDMALASDIVGEEGAKDLKRILDITGEGVGSVKNLASSIVSLGNSAAASESEIVHMVKRLGSSTAQFRISSADLVGMGTAMKEFGLRAEQVGSTTGRAMRTIQFAVERGGRSLSNLRKITDLTGQDIVKAFEESPTKAFQVFLEGLRKVELSGGLMSESLNRIKLSGEEVNAVLPLLALNYDLVNKRVLQANEAFKANIALDQEAGEALNTLAVRFARLKNNFNQWLRSLAESQEGPLNEFVETLNIVFDVMRKGEQGTGMLILIELFKKSIKELFLTTMDTFKVVLLSVGAFVVTVIKDLVLGIAKVLSENNLGKFGIGEMLFGSPEEIDKLGDTFDETIDGILKKALGSAGSIGPLGVALKKSIQDSIDKINELKDSVTDLTTVGKKSPLEIIDLPTINADPNRISFFERAKIQAKQFFGQLGIGYEKAASEMESELGNAAELGESAVGILDSSFQNLFQNIAFEAKNTEDVFRSLRDFASNMLKQIASEIFRIFVVQNAVKGLGSIFGIKSLTTAEVQHSGGISGSGLVSRSVDSSVFNGAARMHSGGIAGDEVPTILKKKEGVFTEGQMKAMGGRGDTNINIQSNVTIEGNVDSNERVQSVSSEIVNKMKTMIQSTIAKELQPGGTIRVAFN